MGAWEYFHLDINVITAKGGKTRNIIPKAQASTEGAIKIPNVDKLSRAAASRGPRAIPLTLHLH